MPHGGAGIRWHFVLALSRGLRVVWPILSSILACQLAFGLLIAWLEDWSLGDGVYFSFVTGLTIGYGDRRPPRPVPVLGHLNRYIGHAAHRPPRCHRGQSPANGGGAMMLETRRAALSRSRFSATGRLTSRCRLPRRSRFGFGGVGVLLPSWRIVAFCNKV